MTTDKAIEFLTALIEQHNVNPYLVTKGDVEALQMGIKALEFQKKFIDIAVGTVVKSGCDSWEEFCEKCGIKI